MDDLIAFIEARLDEDEAAARAVPAPPDWRQGGDGDEDMVLMWPPEPDKHQPDWQGLQADPPEQAAHIARHDPARVLREAAAKRAIIAAHRPLTAEWAAPGGPWCAACGDPGQYSGHDYPCDTLRAIVSVWSDHPGYHAEWAPPA